MQIYLQSKQVEATPVMHKGAPLRVAAPGDAPWDFYSVQYGSGQQRTLMVRPYRVPDGSGKIQLALPPSPAGGPAKEMRLLYKKPNGGLHNHAVVEDAREGSNDGQTCRNTVVADDGTSQDLYLLKGFTYATPADVIAALERADANAAFAEKRKMAQDPQQQVALLAQTMASSLTAAQGQAAQNAQSANKARGNTNG